MAGRKTGKKAQSTEEPRAQGGIPGYSSGIDAANKMKYFANHPEEIANRINTGYGRKAPQFHAPAFEQIPGEQAKGNLLDNPKFDPEKASRRKGDWKFSSGV